MWDIWKDSNKVKGFHILTLSLLMDEVIYCLIKIFPGFKIVATNLFEGFSWKEFSLTICYYHVTYAFQREPTLYGCLNVKELLTQNRHEIWSLTDWNGAKNHNHLFRKRTLNHLAKLIKSLSCVVSTYLYGVFNCMFLSCRVRVSEWIHTL